MLPWWHGGDGPGGLRERGEPVRCLRDGGDDRCSSPRSSSWWLKAERPLLLARNDHGCVGPRSGPRAATVAMGSGLIGHGAWAGSLM